MGSKACTVGHEWAIVGRNVIFYKLCKEDSHNNWTFYNYLLGGCNWVLQQNIPKIIFSSSWVQNVEQVHLEYKCSSLMLKFLWMFGNVSWPCDNFKNSGHQFLFHQNIDCFILKMKCWYVFGALLIWIYQKIDCLLS